MEGDKGYEEKSSWARGPKARVRQWREKLALWISCLVELLWDWEEKPEQGEEANACGHLCEEYVWLKQKQQWVQRLQGRNIFGMYQE